MNMEMNDDLSLERYRPQMSRRLSNLRSLRNVFIVHEHEAALLYRHGNYSRTLPPGRHVVWGMGWSISRIDLRPEVMEVIGQEILTSDHVALKLSMIVYMSVKDPVVASRGVQNLQNHLYTGVQLALRQVVTAHTAEMIVSQRTEMNRKLIAEIQPMAEKVGVEVLLTKIKDIMYPPELRKAYSEIHRARLEGLAALERARGETAALRNLANAARLLGSNPALQNLRWLQAITEAGCKGGSLVLHLPPGLGTPTSSNPESASSVETDPQVPQ